jgi:thioredoxin reductase
MNRAVDLVVIGAGPAGGNAALVAARTGLSVVLIDEQPSAGGQVWRAPWPGLNGVFSSTEARQGDALRARLAGSTVDMRLGRRVWSITSGFRIDAVGPDGNECFAAPRLIAATGAYERVVPFPGWTLPGVVGLAAATVLLKSHAVLPGRRAVVAGCGPLLAAVAAGIEKLGGEVAAVVDLSGRREWLRAAPSLATRPDLLSRGIGWGLKLLTKRIPVYFRYAVQSAGGVEQVERVTLAPVNAAGAPVVAREVAIEADALCVGHGLVPGAEVTKLLRARHIYDPLCGGWIPEVDGFGRTSVPGLFAVGDGAGIRGAAPAELAGEIAGLTVAHEGGSIGHQAFTRSAGRLQERLRSVDRFSAAAASLMALRPAQVASIPPNAVICRCEDVTRAEIDEAYDIGAREANQLKYFTRCGMGPCQGRMCGDIAAELLAHRVGSREAVGHWTGRPPLRPVALEDLIGEFSYDSIPIPEPAPL